jgi:hypothetical protein
MKNFMKKVTLPIALSLALVSPSLAGSDCYVDYKAKQSTSSLKLHYGVMKLPGGACTDNTKAQKVVSKRLAKNGWTLLTILSSFDQSGLSQRQANAGAYFLRY